MSFVHHALPPSDRDDAPELVPADPAPALALERETLLAAIEKAAQAGKDLDRASRLSDWGAYAEAASRLAEVADIRALARHFARGADRALSRTMGGGHEA